MSGQPRPQGMSSESPSIIRSRFIRGGFFLGLGVLAWAFAMNLPHEANLGVGGVILLFGMFVCPLIGGHLLLNAVLARVPKKGEGGTRDLLTTDLVALPGLIIRKILSR